MTTIHATALVEDGAQLGENVSIGPFCQVGANVSLGDGVKLRSHVLIEGHTSLGANSEVHAFACLGGPPQHLGYQGEDTKLIIGDKTVIREHVTMHPGTAQGRGETRVGANGFFMAGSHVAHDCIVGDHVVFANGATLGGHVTIEDYVFMGGLCAVHQFCRIGAYAFVGGMAGVPTDVIPYGSVFGNHAHLAGLNIVGMKRRGMARAVIHELRAAYRLLFAEEGTFQERLADVAERFKDTGEVMRIVDFIRADTSRPLCTPQD
ncbi:MAG: acyl-ACP--UDP-N-acetylglucosamine O-acyltransferase [Pseudomonadota bacterium]